MKIITTTMAIVISAYLALSAGANDIVDSRSTCTTINCSGQKIDGSITAESGRLAANANWIYQAYCGAGECCRFDITGNTSGDALTQTVVGADVLNSIYQPQVGQNPTIAIEPPRSGPYTVIVSTFLETPEIVGNKRFKLRYGRYPAGNPNCAIITPNLVPQ